MQIEITPEEEAKIDITKAIPEAQMGLIVYAEPQTTVPCPDCLSDNVSGDLINFYVESCMTPIPINRLSITYCSILRSAAVSYATRINNRLILNTRFSLFDVSDPSSLINTNINQLSPGVAYDVRVLNSWKFQQQHTTGPMVFSKLSIAKVDKPYPMIYRICGSNPAITSITASKPILMPGSDPSLQNFPDLFLQGISGTMSPTDWGHDSNGWMSRKAWGKTQQLGDGYSMTVSLLSTRFSRSTAEAVFNAALVGPNFIGTPPTQTVYNITGSISVNPAALEPRGGITITGHAGWLAQYVQDFPTIAAK